MIFILFLKFVFLWLFFQIILVILLTLENKNQIIPKVYYFLTASLIIFPKIHHFNLLLHYGFRYTRNFPHFLGPIVNLENLKFYYSFCFQIWNIYVHFERIGLWHQFQISKGDAACTKCSKEKKNITLSASAWTDLITHR